MPGGKVRLKGLYTGGQQVGPTGTWAKHILAGSAIVEAPSIGAVAGSTASLFVTIAAMTASHIINAVVASGNACTALSKASTGAGSALFTWAYVAGSGLGVASQTTTQINYIAFQV